MFQAMFLGNLADNAHIEKGNNSQFCSFRAASSRKSKDGRTGQDVVITTWVTVNVNSNYENLMQYLLKGVKVFVIGNMSTRIYQDRAGMSQVGITIQAAKIELCGSPTAHLQQQSAPQGYQPTRPAPQDYQPQQQPPQGYQPAQPAPQGYQPQQQPPQGYQQPPQAGVQTPQPQPYFPQFAPDAQPF